MTGKVIQGSFLTGQPRWSPSVQPKIAPSSFPAKVVVPPRTVFALRPLVPAHAAQPTALQRHGAGGAFAVEAGPLGLVSSGGRPLPDAVRGKMEAALGADFRAVRVHVGPQAERIGAIAFTVGSDIYFAPGRYQPDTIQGQQLLGHELAHVVQQRAGRVRNPLGAGLAVVQDRALEAEADRMGQCAAAHRVAAQAKMALGAVQLSAPVRISPPVSAGPGSYRLSAGAAGREIGSVLVHTRARGAVEVTDLRVDPGQRGNGVGQMLVAAAARAGLQTGRSTVTLAAQDRGNGHLTRWYRDMGFTQTGVNARGYPQLEAPIGRVTSRVAQSHAIKPKVNPLMVGRPRSTAQLSISIQRMQAPTWAQIVRTPPPVQQPQDPTTDWEWTRGGTNHEHDGWWRAMGVSRRVDVTNAIEDILNRYYNDIYEGNLYKIDFGEKTVYEGYERVTRPCFILFSFEMEGNVQTISIIHCGPGGDRDDYTFAFDWPI